MEDVASWHMIGKEWSNHVKLPLDSHSRKKRPREDKGKKRGKSEPLNIENRLACIL